jgi:hypothetical protein
MASSVKSGSCDDRAPGHRPPGQGRRPLPRQHCGGDVCERWRAQAAALCSICGEPIGFDVMFTVDEPPTKSDFAPEVLTHALCAAAKEFRSPTT